MFIKKNKEYLFLKSMILEFNKKNHPIASFPKVFFNTFVCIGCYLNSDIYDLALIQSFFGIFEIGSTFFHSKHRRIFKNAKTLLI